MNVKGYQEEMKVSYAQIDGDRKMTPSALLETLQEAAISHSDALGYSLEYWAEHKQGWSVVNWHIVIHRLPTKGETLRIETWSDRCRKIQATRSYRIFDEAENLLVEVASRWIYMDLESRKATSVSEEMIEAYGSQQEAAIPDEKFIMPKSAEGEPVAERTFVVTRRDTDTNGHANNVRYLEWAMDDVPDEIYDDMQLKDIRAVYRKECMRGEEVTAHTYCRENEGATQVLTFLMDKDEHVIAEIATLWTSAKA